MAALDTAAGAAALAAAYTAAFSNTGPATRLRHLSTVRSACTWWRDNARWIAGDPTATWIRPKVSVDTTRALTRDQVAALWRLDVALRDKTLWRALYETAARAEEILTLDVGDLDLPNKRARVVSKGEKGLRHMSRIQVSITTRYECDAIYLDYDPPLDGFLELDLQDGVMRCDYYEEYDNRCPESVFHNRVLRFTIPTLTAKAANELMTGAVDLAQRILDGAEIVWNGHNHVGRLDQDAVAASEALSALCAADNFSNSDLFSQWKMGGPWCE